MYNIGERKYFGEKYYAERRTTLDEKNKIKFKVLEQTPKII